MALYLLIYYFAGDTSKINAKLRQITEDKSKVAKEQQIIRKDKYVSESNIKALEEWPSHLPLTY